jgi:hypothetical protein
MSRTLQTVTGLLGAAAAIGVVAWLWAGPAADARRAETAVVPAQTPAGDAPSPTRVSAFDGNRAWEHLQQIVGIGPRPSGSAGIRQTRAYIGRQLAAMGVTVQEQAFTASTPAGRIDMANLIVRLPGKRADRILFTGHYDTKLFKDKVFVGASDGGSSAAFLVELARVLNERKDREFTYELVWLDGEEAVCREWYECGTPGSPDNTYGSRYYVQAAEKAGALKSMRANILVDMIGDRDLRFQRESNSTPWLKDIIWTTAQTMAYGHVFVDAEMAVEDDHIPFLRAGIPSVDIIDLDYPAWHTPDDTLDKVSARSLQIVGDVLVTALPRIEERLR